MLLEPEAVRRLPASSPGTAEALRWPLRDRACCWSRRLCGGSRQDPESLLELFDGDHRGVLALEVVVEDPLPLRLRQLRGEDRADVDRAVEVHAVRDVVREPLVDGDMAILLGADEVRPGDPPQGGNGEQREDEQDADDVV